MTEVQVEGKPQITEPMTMITDYLIAIELLIFIWLLRSSLSNTSVFFFELLFLATAIGAIAGGTAHGFAEYLGETGRNKTWLITVQGIGFGTTFFELGLITEYFSGTTKSVGIAAVIIQLVAFEYWILTKDEIKFSDVILNYGGTMLISLIYLIFSYYNDEKTSMLYLIISIVIGFLAAIIQQSGFAIHKHFNHNDIYHVIQMFGLYYFYLAAKQFSN
ncbi:MAG: DUF6962 family protein [Candidatus Kariarchaeaceae archaeon]|jgi:hypothetical protein